MTPPLLRCVWPGFPWIPTHTGPGSLLMISNSTAWAAANRAKIVARANILARLWWKSVAEILYSGFIWILSVYLIFFWEVVILKDKELLLGAGEVDRSCGVMGIVCVDIWPHGGVKPGKNQ